MKKLGIVFLIDAGLYFPARFFVGPGSMTDQTKNNEEYVVENKANRAIIFPSNFIFKHTVTPVKKGTRFSIVGWGL